MVTTFQGISKPMNCVVRWSVKIRLIWKCLSLWIEINPGVTESHEVISSCNHWLSALKGFLDVLSKQSQWFYLLTIIKQLSLITWNEQWTFFEGNEIRNVNLWISMYQSNDTLLIVKSESSEVLVLNRGVY